MNKTCSHLQTHDNTPARTQGCEECMRLGEGWVHLRRCLACGHVGCCDSSKNKHATQHFHHTKHPVVQSYEPGETWTWCYVDTLFGKSDTEQSYGEAHA
jgi:hypothetical protein